MSSGGSVGEGNRNTVLERTNGAKLLSTVPERTCKGVRQNTDRKETNNVGNDTTQTTITERMKSVEP